MREESSTPGTVQFKMSSPMPYICHGDECRYWLINIYNQCIYLHHFVRVDPLLGTTQHQDFNVGVTERVPLGAGVDNLGAEWERLHTITFHGTVAISAT